MPEQGDNAIYKAARAVSLLEKFQFQGQAHPIIGKPTLNVGTISGGLNIYPKEIEDVLNDQTGVVESAVIGVPHPDFGEGIVAVLVGESTLDMEQLEAVCREKLAGFKVPRRWEQLETLPRNTMGKVQKNVLRDDYIDSFQK
jgi:malonyl-CoA/methylmalonyl-CoA synthetase